MFHAEDPHSQGDSRVTCITGGAGMFHAEDPQSQGDSRISLVLQELACFLPGILTLGMIHVYHVYLVLQEELACFMLRILTLRVIHV